MSSPTYIYKITDSAPPSPLSDTLPLSALDSQDGFIHLSNAERIPITADLFFTDSDRLWVLKVAAAAAETDGAELRWVESEELAGCVHLHGGKLGREDVVAVREYERGNQEDWAQAFTRIEDSEKWLVDV